MAKAPPKKISEVKGTGSRVNRKVHAGRYVHDAAYDEDRHDCGPWIEVNSSRVEAIRYDYLNNAVQVLWVGRPRERGYVYLDVPYERFRSFIRSGSKGKYINSALNSYEYRPMTPEELDAPSNDRYSRMGA
jgi:hypothetical protein